MIISKTKALLFLFFFILSYLILTNAEDETKLKSSKNVQKAITSLQKANNMIGKVNKFIAKANPGKIFAKLSNVLGALGPAMMVVSSILSIVAIFLPQEEQQSAELKAINEGFEKVNRKLDVITTDIKDLKNIVELTGAKSAYVKSITSIKNNFEALEEAKKENTKESYDYFLKLYDTSYNLDAANLYDAMTGQLGPFGFHLVNLYKDSVKCNAILVSQFCTMGMQLIIKGLTIEGAYFGAHNLTAKAKSKQEIWEVKMKTLGDSCTAVIEKCENDWKIISAQTFRESYKKDFTNNNKELANKILKSLSDTIPQRSWFVAAYDDASGSGEHTYVSTYEVDKIWNENNHDVTIFSTEVEEPRTGVAFDEFVASFDTSKANLKNITDCSYKEWYGAWTYRYAKREAISIINMMMIGFKQGVIYAIQNDKNPGYAISGNTLYASKQEWVCASESYALLIFI